MSESTRMRVSLEFDSAFWSEATEAQQVLAMNAALEAVKGVEHVVWAQIDTAWAVVNGTGRVVTTCAMKTEADAYVEKVPPEHRHNYHVVSRWW